MSDCFDAKKCGYKTRITYEIIKTDDGEVVNSVVDDLSWPATAEEAIAHKYAIFSIIYGRDREGKIRAQEAADAAMK